MTCLVSLVDEAVVCLHEPLPAAVSPPGAGREGVGAEPGPGQREEPHHRLVVVPQQQSLKKNLKIIFKNIFALKTLLRAL